MDLDKLRKIKIKDTNLAEILDAHKKIFSIRKTDDNESFSYSDFVIENVDLSNVDLSGADLRYFTFSNVNFENAFLKETFFTGSTFRFVNFKNADLRRSKFINCDFHNCSFDNAFMYNCDLSKSIAENTSFKSAIIEYAILKGVNFRCNVFLETSFEGSILEYSELKYSAFRFVNLKDCSLKRSDMTASNFMNTDFARAFMKDAILVNCNFYSNYNLDKIVGKNNNYIEGKVLTDNIIGYKKCMDYTIVTLEIPRGAIVFSIDGTKCRTNKAKVIAIDGADRAYSKHSTYSEHNRTYGHMSYYVGDEITVYNFDCKYNEECSRGIHFFLTREEAEDYEFF